MNKNSLLTLSLLLALTSTVKSNDPEFYDYDTDTELAQRENQYNADFENAQTAGGRVTPLKAAQFEALKATGRTTPTRRNSTTSTSPEKNRTVVRKEERNSKQR